MNERIRQLKEQAEIKFESHPQHSGIDTAVIIPSDLEKFAELIVRECASVQHKRFCEHGDVSWDILMEHFGVEL